MTTRRQQRLQDLAIREQQFLEQLRAFEGTVGEATRWLDAPAGTGRFSPDGNWVAHETLASGQAQVVVTSYPEADQRYGIAAGVGGEPLWRADGKELVYRSRDTMMSVEIDLEAQPTPIIGTPQIITEIENNRTGHATPDLKRLLLVRVMQSEPGKAIRIVDNWMP